jgi:hypothetical protein
VVWCLWLQRLVNSTHVGVQWPRDDCFTGCFCPHVCVNRTKARERGQAHCSDCDCTEFSERDRGVFILGPRVSSGLARQVAKAVLGLTDETLPHKTHCEPLHPQHDSAQDSQPKTLARSALLYSVEQSYVASPKFLRVHPVPARPGGEVSPSIPLDRLRP